MARTLSMVTSTHLVLCLVLTMAGTQDTEGTLEVDSIVAGAHDITVTIATNVTHPLEVTISVSQPDSGNVTILDSFTIPGDGDTLSSPYSSFMHRVSGLASSTHYKVCMSAQRHATYHECYTVATLPIPDNLSGVYAALIAMLVVFVVAGLGWAAYRLYRKKQENHFVVENPKYQSDGTTQETTTTTTTPTTSPPNV